MDFKRNLFLFSLLLASLNVYGSDARSYLLVPTDTTLAEFRFANSVTVTPSRPADVRIENQTTSVKLTHYYDLFGTLGALQINAPYTRLDRSGANGGAAAGMSDASIAFGFGLYNTPALSKGQFHQFNKNGFSAAGAVTLTTASGEYDKTTALNTGTNRSSQKFEIQTAWRNDGWLLELLGGFTQFNRNNAYLVSNSLGQKNLSHAETHVSYNLTPRLWASLDLFYLSGGELVLNGSNMNNSQRSLSGGGVVGYSPGTNQLIKLIYQNTISGSNVSTRLEGLALSYTLAF